MSSPTPYPNSWPPAQGLFFRSISVHDDFVVDSVFTEGVFRGLCHGSAVNGRYG
jgi:hypothetical protein